MRRFSGVPRLGTIRPWSMPSWVWGAASDPRRRSALPVRLVLGRVTSPACQGEIAWGLRGWPRTRAPVGPARESSAVGAELRRAAVRLEVRQAPELLERRQHVDRDHRGTG